MPKSHFYAYMARMRLIKRWSLRRSTIEENDQEHSLQVAMIAHALAVIGKRRLFRVYDEELLLKLAIYHEAAEVITGDLASPIKYFNPGIHKAFKQIERLATEKLIGYLPEDLRPEYEPLLFPDESSGEWKLVKAADKICAYLKCVEELSLGNREFATAESDIRRALTALNMPEVDEFMQEFAPSFSMPLDQLD
jgi:5'-deoxynucleotidase